MATQKRTAAAPKLSKSSAKRTVKATKPATAARKRSAKTPKREGFLDTVVEGAKELPAQVAHGVGQVVEKAGEIASVAAEKTGAAVGEVVNKVGLGSDKKPATGRAKRK
jgi:hypothetical protein